jgi:hypothetical protein
MAWGDQLHGKHAEVTGLRHGDVALVPIARRREDGDGAPAILADLINLNKQTERKKFTADRTKHRFRLRVKARTFERASGFYHLRVPRGKSNGHFTVEMEYEGAGTQGAPSIAT